MVKKTVQWNKRVRIFSIFARRWTVWAQLTNCCWVLLWISWQKNDSRDKKCVTHRGWQVFCFLGWPANKQQKIMLTKAPRLVSKHLAHHTVRGWLAVEWHLGAGSRSLLNFLCSHLLQCLQFPAWEQPPPPAWGRLRFPVWENLPFAWARLQSQPGTLASSLPGNVCQYPAWACLPIPCLGMFAIALPGTLASALPRNAFAGTLSQAELSFLMLIGQARDWESFCASLS